MRRADLVGRLVIIRMRLEGALRDIDDLVRAGAPLRADDAGVEVPDSVARRAVELGSSLIERARRLEKDADQLRAAAEVKPS